MTTKYCGFLRGINVGNIRINMDDLKQLLEKEGFTGVKTFLQTGNVSFKSEKTAPELKEILEKKLSTRFEYEAYIQILPFTQLNEIISSYPFIKNESEHCYIVFTQKKSTITEL
nr:DUF1697 domain-containing protein [Pseudarcicella sp.]